MDARELSLSPEYLSDRWKCPGCKVEMIPVACDAGDYRISPHFRANGQHEQSCEYDGIYQDAKDGEIRTVEETMGPPEFMPGVLRLAGQRPQHRELDCDEHTELSTNRYRGKGSEQTSLTTHESTATTLRRIAEGYCRYPSERNRRLKIPGCHGKTYEQCFGELRNANELVQFEVKVLFAPIRFKRPIVHGSTITLELNPAIWLTSGCKGNSTQPDMNYCITFHTEKWSESILRRFNSELNEAVTAQRENNEDKTWSTYVFFLGEQDNENLAQFNVRDHRLVCFIKLHRDVYHSLGKRGRT